MSWDRIGTLSEAASKAMEYPIVHDYGVSLGYASYGWSRYDFENRARFTTETDHVNAAVGQCIAKHAVGYPMASWQILRKTASGKDEPNPNHPLLATLARPNPIMAWPDLARIITVYRCVGGNAYLHIVRSRAGDAVELWPYHDGHITPVPGGPLWIQHYLFHRPDGTQTPIEREDIIHLKWPVVSAAEPWKGVSPLVQIAREADSDNEMTRIVYTYLKNDATPRGALIDAKGTIASPQQRASLMQQWHAEQGGENRGRMPVLTGFTFQRFALDFKELDLSSIRAVPEARIAGAFLTDVIHAGLTAGMVASTYDNRRGAREFFFEDALVPMWQADAETMTQLLMPSDATHYIWPYTRDVPALRKDLNAAVSRAVLAFEKGILRRNEARAILDLDPVTDEEDVWFAEIGGAAPRPDEPEPTLVDDEEPVPDEELPDKGFKNDAEAKAVAYWKSYDTPAEKFSAQLAAALAKPIAAIEREVLKSVGSKSRGRKDDERFDLFDTDDAEDALAAASRVLLKSYVDSVFEQAVTEVGENWRTIRSQFDEAIGRTLKGSTEKITTAVGTIKDDLQTLLRDNSDLPADELTQLVKEKFSFYSEAGAARIARTTATYATGSSQREAWGELDVEYSWLSQRDGATRDSHRSADGQRPDKEGYFKVGGDRMRHPGAGSIAKENVNCRCVLRGTIRE